MEIHNALRDLGLHKTEAAVYLFLLENGQSSPAQIAKGTGILRTNAYHVLEQLEAQTLIRAHKIGKRKVYLARDPESLYQSLEIKRETISRILPDLRGLYATQHHKPKVQFYENADQISEVYWRSLEAREIFAIGSTKSLQSVLPDLYEHYIREVKNRNIVFHDLITAASRTQAGPRMQEVLKGLYDMRYLPAKHDDIPTDLLIWNESIAHITLEEPLFATVITSPLIARTMRTLFGVIREGI
jgi:sugar-specific transcriptional regulator TrmB